jgi:hypothetical protein
VQRVVERRDEHAARRYGVVVRDREGLGRFIGNLLVELRETTNTGRVKATCTITTGGLTRRLSFTTAWR